MDPWVWSDASVTKKFKNSELLSFSKLSIPLKPRIHPKNELEVFDVYVIISSSILISP